MLQRLLDYTVCRHRQHPDIMSLWNKPDFFAAHTHAFSHWVVESDITWAIRFVLRGSP